MNPPLMSTFPNWFGFEQANNFDHLREQQYTQTFGGAMVGYIQYSI